MMLLVQMLSSKKKILEKVIQEKVHKGKMDTYNTLPDIACVRDNHKLLSLYCEKRIAEEMLEKNVSCRTSRQDVGGMAGAVWYKSW